MVRLIVVLAIAGTLTIFALQNTMPIALVIVGIKTPALPLSVWVLLAIAAGAFTMAIIAGLYRVSTAFTLPSPKREPRRPTSPDRPSTAGWQAAGGTRAPAQPKRPSRPATSAADESWESFSQPLNDSWERGERRDDDWEDWSDEPEPEPVRRSYQPPYRSSSSSYVRDERQEPRRSEEPRYAESRYEDSRYEEPRYAESRYEDSRYDDSRYDEPRYEESRSDHSQDADSRSWYDRLNHIPVVEPVSRLPDDDYLVTFPDEDEEDEAKPQRDDWDDWEEDEAQQSEKAERSPDPPSPPRRTEFERPQEPKASYRSGTVYSYKYRDASESLDDDDQESETNYRVIIPPQRPPSEPSTPSESASDTASPNTTARDDWSFMEDDDWRDRRDRPTV